MVVEVIQVCIIASGCNTISGWVTSSLSLLKGVEAGIKRRIYCSSHWIVWHPQYLSMGSHHLILAMWATLVHAFHAGRHRSQTPTSHDLCAYVGVHTVKCVHWTADSLNIIRAGYLTDKNVSIATSTEECQEFKVGIKYRSRFLVLFAFLIYSER